MDLRQIVENIADALQEVDRSRVPYRRFAPGVGPYGEPQLVKMIAKYLNHLPGYAGNAKTKRTPDLLIPCQWALEFKIARPFGDNGKEAEDWSTNLLHPYPGSTSSIGDALKLQSLKIPERRGVVVIGYEHHPAQISLNPLIQCFETLAMQVLEIRLGRRIEITRQSLIHPVHQTLRLFAWEVEMQ